MINRKCVVNWLIEEREREREREREMERETEKDYN